LGTEKVAHGPFDDKQEAMADAIEHYTDGIEHYIGAKLIFKEVGHG